MKWKKIIKTITTERPTNEINYILLFILRLTHKQNMNFTYLLRHYKLFRACAHFRCLCKTKNNLELNLKDFYK